MTYDWGYDRGNLEKEGHKKLKWKTVLVYLKPLDTSAYKTQLTTKKTNMQWCILTTVDQMSWYGFIACYYYSHKLKQTM